MSEPVSKELELEDLVEGEGSEDRCAPGAPASWSRGRMPDPVDDALEALLLPATWGRSQWRSAAWRS